MIYCVEDDQNIRDLIIYTLKSSGFTAAGFEDGAKFWDAMKEAYPELILLDIMLPGEDGLTILARLKHQETTQAIPVILVTARGSEYDKVTGLDAGADDYIAKPFGMMEFISRVRALLRRTSHSPVSQEEELKAGPLTLNVPQHTVTAVNTEISLTLKEFELLKRLMEKHGAVLSRDTLLAEIWGYDFDGETRTVDVHIGTLRQKLGACGDLVETVRGVGYRIGDTK